MLIHPYTTQMAVVGWTSPVTARVTMTASFQSAQLVNCGNGIQWTLDRGAATLIRAQVTPLQTGEGFSIPLSVQVKQTFYLTINSYQQDYSCDSTLVAWTIATA
jgi:hypothetical protein